MVYYIVEVIIVIYVVVYIDVIDYINFPAIFLSHAFHVLKTYFGKGRNLSSTPVNPDIFREFGLLNRYENENEE